jgi:hypothetical protein
MNRSFFGVICLALLGVVGCSGAGSPTDPSNSSSSTGATITGTVSGGGAPITVVVEGTDLSAAVDSAGSFRLAGVRSGDARLRFSEGSMSATALVSAVREDELIDIQVSLNGQTATIVGQSRTTSKIRLCHRTDSQGYHLIDVSVSAEPAHRAHGDGEIGDPVPGTSTKVFNARCEPAGVGVNIEKMTNDQDADHAPGPSIRVGEPVTWTYIVTNNGAVALSNVTVVDDRGVTVNCGLRTTLAVGASMTCTGTGLAVLGPYSNIGTVTASSSAGPVRDSDPSHYLGVLDDDGDSRKVQLCHRTGNGSYHLIEVSVSAEPAHRAHGDGAPGESVPSQPGRVFGPSCALSPAP